VFHLAPKAPPKASNELPEARPASRSGSKLKRRRSPSATSADSFAGADEWEDRAKVYLASNRQFEVPLSELGRRATEREFQEAHHSMAKTSPHPTPREPTQLDLSSIEVLPASGPGATKVQQHGVKSDGALSQLSAVSDIPDEASTPPVMSNPGSIDYLDSRAEDYQATQPLASEDQDMNNTQVTDVIELQQRQTSAWNSEASRPSRNTRNILSMVNPEKRWRLQRGEQLLQAALQNDSDGQTQPSSNFPGSSSAPNTGRKLFDHLAAQMLADQQSSPRHDQERQSNQDLPLLDEDSRDAVIVPDSEPPESANASSIPARPHLLTPPKDSLHDGRVDSSLSQPALVPSMGVEDEVSRRGDGKDDQIDDDDDEEDIPLHLTVRRSKTGAAPPSTKVNYTPESRVLKPTRRAVETKASGTRGIYPRNNEIPSSVPEQDHRSSSVPPSPKITNPRLEGKEREDTEEDPLVPGGRSDQVTPAPDEGSTEPADDLLMDTDDDVPALQDVKASSSRRRPPASRRKVADGSAPRMASNTPSMVLGARSTKKNKNHHATATRVFALWKQDAAYFSGIVFERVGQSDRFKINFDDGDEDLVDLKNIRRLELQIGDRVSIIESHEKASIAKVDGQHQDTVTVRLTDDSSAELEIKVSGLKIQSRAIRSQWGDRTMNANEIVTLVSRTKLETPTTSLRNSSASLSKRVLSKVGIVVTLSVGRDWEREKDMITRIIRTNGGTVLDDWCDIFSLVGEYSFNKKRWVITSDNIGTELKDDIHQVFLVSDAANAKPRFLTALALGIPCLSVEWLRDLSSGVSFTAGFDESHTEVSKAMYRL
jgi:DNA repair protein Crb2 Tudor domain/BRCA1 C Terminus (BRCT) domain